MANSNVRILFITRAYPPIVGGMERLSHEITANLAKLTETHLIANRRGKKFLPFFLPVALIKAIFILPKIDVVHLGDPVLSIIGWIIKKIFQKPVAVTIHGKDVTFENKIYQIYLKKFGLHFDLYICISRYAQNLAKKIGITKTTVVPVGINDDHFDPAIKRTQLNQILKEDASKKKIFLTVGRLVRRKGVRWFINKVLPHLHYYDYLYLVAGEGPYKQRIKEAIKKRGLEKKIKILGEVTNTEKKILYNTADLFIMPNVPVKKDAEGFGIVALEAASCKLPVIASSLEGIPDAIQSEKNGFLVKAAEPKQYIHRIEYLLENEKFRKEFGEKARAYTLEKFSWNKISQRYLEAFRDLARPH